ncbi:MAG: extracellular solute-binding protein [Clostridia bacterium]|nr:extracellular solute-binding protein [Clostridia bacterium]
MKRFFSAFIALIMLFSVLSLASCGDSSSDSESTEPVTLSSQELAESMYIETYDPRATAQTYIEDVPKDTTYDGYEFTFLNSSAIYYMYIYLDPDMTGDVLDDTCFERNLLAEQKFDITIEEETQPYNELASYAKTIILADEDVYDVMYVPAADLTPLISENLFRDLLEIDELHIDNIWWDQPLITRNTIENRLFYATSDLNLMAFEGVWCMYFNEDMMTDLGLDLPYSLALDGKWTYDELKRYCAAAANLNGDSSFTFKVDGNAGYGLVSSSGSPTNISYGMGAEYASRDENGRYHFTADTDPRFNQVWELLVNFYGPNDGLYVLGTPMDLDPDGYYGIFMANRALFLHAELKGATMLREWEGNFGLLPQPKFDATQESYNSNVFSRCLSFCVPNTNTNLERTGTIIDYLTYESYAELMPRYYDIHVALKALGKQESIDVLALVRGTRGCEVAVPFGWAKDLNDKLTSLALNNEMALASTIESYKEQVVTNINMTYEEYPTHNHVEE